MIWTLQLLCQNMRDRQACPWETYLVNELWSTDRWNLLYLYKQLLISASIILFFFFKTFHQFFLRRRCMMLEINVQNDVTDKNQIGSLFFNIPFSLCNLLCFTTSSGEVEDWCVSVYSGWRGTTSRRCFHWCSCWDPCAMFSKGCWCYSARYTDWRTREYMS